MTQLLIELQLLAVACEDMHVDALRAWSSHVTLLEEVASMKVEVANLGGALFGMGREVS